MKIYWDSSALVLALHDAAIRDRIRRGQSLTRPHTLAELFTTLTKGVNFRYSPRDAAHLLDDLARDMDFIELSETDTLKAIASAGGQGVRGARIHDLLHAAAARKGRATVLMTLDAAGFSGLELDLAIQAP